MLTLSELLAQHQAAHVAYSKLYAASKAVSKQLNEAQKLRSTIRQQLALLIGPLHIGMLVQTLNGSRFYEIAVSVDNGRSYHAVPVYKHTGATKRVETNQTVQPIIPHFLPTVYVQAGSVKPVPPDHPVYLRWQKQKFRQKLEGGD